MVDSLSDKFVDADVHLTGIKVQESCSSVSEVKDRAATALGNIDKDGSKVIYEDKGAGGLIVQTPNGDSINLTAKDLTILKEMDPDRYEDLMNALPEQGRQHVESVISGLSEAHTPILDAVQKPGACTGNPLV